MNTKKKKHCVCVWMAVWRIDIERQHRCRLLSSLLGGVRVFQISHRRCPPRPKRGGKTSKNNKQTTGKVRTAPSPAHHPQRTASKVPLVAAASTVVSSHLHITFIFNFLLLLLGLFFVLLLHFHDDSIGKRKWVLTGLWMISDLFYLLGELWLSCVAFLCFVLFVGYRCRRCRLRSLLCAVVFESEQNFAPTCNQTIHVESYRHEHTERFCQCGCHSLFVGFRPRNEIGQLRVDGVNILMRPTPLTLW